MTILAFSRGSGTPAILLSNTTVAEDLASGEVVGALSVKNGKGGSYTFTITADPDSKFAIDGSNLETDAALDYETATSHSVTIQADNSAGHVFSQTFTITVTDVVSEFDADAETYFAAAATPPDTTRKGHINTLVLALKSSSVWTKLDFLYLFAAHEEQLSLVNLKAPGTFNALKVNTPVHVVDDGWTCSGASSSLNTQFTPSTASGQWALNSAHMGVWSRTNGSTTTVSMGARTATGDNETLLIPRTTTNLIVRMNQDVQSGNAASDGSSLGHTMVVRSASNVVRAYRNGVDTAGHTAASTALATVAIHVGAYNSGGTPESFNTTYQYAAAHGGAALDATESDALYDALAAYMTAVGA